MKKKHKKGCNKDLVIKPFPPGDYSADALRLKREMCYSEYNRYKDSYDKVYNKASIALAFCGVLIAFLYNTFNSEAFSFCFAEMEPCAIAYSVLVALGLLLLICATIILLILMCGNKIKAFNCIGIPVIEEELPEYGVEEWLIQVLSVSIDEIKTKMERKQALFNWAVIMAGVSFVLFSIAIIVF